MTDPLLPRSTTNPAGQTERIRTSTKAARKRLVVIRNKLLREWERIPYELKEVPQVNELTVNQSFYSYLIDVAELARIILGLKNDLGQTAQDQVADAAQAAYRQGTAQAAENLARLSDDYPRTAATALQATPIQRRIALVGSRVFESMAKFQGDLGSELSRILQDGVANGLNPREVARSIRKRFSISGRRAERIARTEITTALRRAHWDESQDAADRFGIRTAQMHFSALLPTTRQTHAARHGKVFSTQEVREWYEQNGNAINCYVPGTHVAGRFIAGSKAHYEGAVIDIVTAAGHHLTVTPNHPVMTSRGMVAAAEINEADSLIAHRGQAEDLAGVGDLHGELMHPSIEDVFGSMVNVGHSSLARVSGVDFHGDARGMNKGVQIVDAERVLTCGMDALDLKFLDDLKLVSANSSTVSNGSSGFNLNAVFLPASSFLSRLGDALSLLWRSVCHPKVHVFTVGSPSETLLFKPSVEGSSSDAVFFAQGQNGGSSDVLSMDRVNVKHVLDVFSARVISVGHRYYSGFVYDLQEVSGLMIANGVISSNCRCAQRTVTLDENGDPIISDRLQKKLDDQRKQFTAMK